MSMKVAFAGTPAFAAAALEAILAAGHQVPLVLTQPDRPAGRGKQLKASEVKQVALQHGLPVYQPERLRDPATHQPLLEVAPDVLVVAAYGLILPQAVLDIPRYGCLNIHASLLPRWRGAAPIHRAIEAGDAETGNTIMQMDAGLDTGAMLLREAMPISAEDTTASLHDKLAAQGARLIVDALARLSELTPTPQPEDGVVYAHKIEKREAALDFSLSASALARRIRAFDPFPGTTTTLSTEQGALDVKIWQAHALAGVANMQAGTVLAAGADGIDIACGDGVLRVTQLQKPGGKRLSTADFLRGERVLVG